MTRMYQIQGIIIFIVLFLCCVTCDIIVYNHHVIAAEQPEFLIIPKFQKGEVPNWKPGKGRSYIDISRLRVTSTCYTKENNNKDICAPASFDLLVFKAPMDAPWQNLWKDDNYCCTKELSDAGSCPPSSINRLIVPKSLSEVLIRSAVVYPNETAVSVNEEHISKIDIQQSGLYVVLVAQCQEGIAPVILDGALESLDPYGYVPADAFGNLPFYLTLSSMYLIIATVWGILCYLYRDQLMPLQHWITLVLLIGMFETSLLFSHYLDWNDSGLPQSGLATIGVIFGVMKRTFSRILVTLVALGYGVVRPTLGDDMYRVLYLGAAYCLLSFIYSLSLHTSTSNQSAIDSWRYDFMSLVIFLLAFIDTTFYIWIFTSINNLMISLASRKQGVKYLLYRQFRTVLFIMLFATCCWAIYGSLFFLNDDTGTNKYWREKWTIDALWEVIYFVIFVAIAVLWAPSRNSQRYAYSMEIGQLEDDEEWLQNTSVHGFDDENSTDGGVEMKNLPVASPKVKSAGGNSGERQLDAEYGGSLGDENDPFQGTGALDPLMALAKKH